MKINNVIEQIEAYAASQPDTISYDYLGDTKTYADIKRDSDTLAAHIDGMNLPDKAPVMVFGGHEYEMIVSFLALIKSGHAYVPVDVDSSEDRVKNILEIGQPAAVIAVDTPSVKIDSVPVISKDELAAILAKPADYTISHSVTGDENFYILFTSGTTGKPKGVQISHDNVRGFLNWMHSDDFNLSTGENFLSQAPYSFDISMMAWGNALTSGGTIKALPNEVAEDFKKLFATLPTMDLEIWSSTPSFADVALLDPEFKQENYPKLKTFMFCGEVLTSTTVKKLFDRFPDTKIYNTYGPTEATVAVSSMEITPEVVEKNVKLPIGYVRPDTEMVIQEDGKDLPNGESGEIIIAGEPVSKGYLNNPEKTKAAFTTYKGMPAYHTGDLGVKDDDGLLHYKGRMDFQIKLHGFRIELEEVAQQLHQSQWVEQAAAVPRYDADGKVKQIIAIIVPKKNDFEKPMDLTNAIKADLTNVMMPYMIPGRFKYRESMPLTPNGKINLKGLIAEENGNA
ncbi:D-alanine--poly(phosphoribitol) ligase subunit DltA [Eupransor demetentiae]|uniref:D-alanine--poly(phosphoribitol) ligase subunit DltA n=1 Tax=Eupransor demetentiae TaxID=3109584 RepID=UPI0032E358CA